MITVNLIFLFRLFILSLAIAALVKCFSTCAKLASVIFLVLLAVHLIWNVRFVW